MGFQQFLTIIKARKKIAILVFIVTVATTTVLSMISPKSYDSTVSLVVNLKTTDPLTGAVVPILSVPGFMATQVDIITSQTVALKVVDSLKLYTNPVLISRFNLATGGEGDIKYWIADTLIKNLTVSTPTQSNVINITYETQNPVSAAQIANAFAEAYLQTNLELKVKPSLRTEAWFAKKVKMMRNNLLAAQEKLSTYQSQNGILQTDQRYGVESAKLAQMTQQLVSAQSNLFDAESRKKAILENNIDDISPDVLKDPMINTIKVSLAKAEVKLADVRQRVGTQHPDYRSVQSEIYSLKKRLKKEQELAKNTIFTSVKIAKQNVNDLQKLVDQQKQVMLQVNAKRDMLNLLKRDMDDKSKILSMATQSLSQISLQGSSNQTDISILNPAVPSIKPSKPKVVLNVALSVFFGLILAIGFAMLAELLNRKVRSANDISNLGVQVLSEIDYVKS